ncbi:hypothetical protein JOF56_005548 [Kibdelosporangium banguiense]|uniref:Uncharacterized protein n=1 Tax=Kibdelosporangium banguiense TaxID=1365924 RepID=A0ABS4TML1_9PSEU|nr:hypothetical protein [Kibdelosporangium banguiense]MBP2325163.1 hypothetical protein [Kibdelosporangium banguiense]
MWRADLIAEQDVAELPASRLPARPPSPLLAAGNQAMARVVAQPQMFAQLWGVGSVIDSAVDLVGGLVQGIVGQSLRGSVGRGGDNNPGDVLVVMRLLAAAGYADADMAGAITRFQREVVEMSRPDGRVDPGGRTFRALASASSSSAAAPAPAEVAPSSAGAVSADPAGIEAELAALAALQRQAPKKGGEESGPQRAELVERIGELRKAIKGISDPEQRARYFERLTAVAPFYSQYSNKAFLHTTVKIVNDSTCNITTVAMGLELLGKSAGDYVGDRARLEIVEHWVEGRIGSEINTDSARLPDFLQLAAIVEKLGGVTDPSEEQLNEARRVALNEWITKGASALITLFARFGVKAEEVTSPESKDLRAIGAKYRDDLLKIASGREAAGKHEVIGGDDVKDVALHESKVELNGYKEWVKQRFEPLLAEGRPVCLGMFNHWTRLQSIDDEHIVIDDPGGGRRANRTFTWEAARAVGLFWHSVVAQG